ncbi:MAG: IS30 family transposase [Elusimicrobiales bacterium]|nr:IS30 family transposase [Elusimicrobiales bacterium]MCK5106844.1 IS30 family transposase [Elusimicrobiales bacterium]MCK5583558.1 IS30 family transposase [Elusimicrobiales bacterium]
MTYRHLTKEERDKLSVLRSKGWKLREIAAKLGRNIGTLSRELKRNGRRGQYLPHKAQERTESRASQSHKKKRLKTYALRNDIEKQLMNKWSPEIISGRLKKQNGGKTVISCESIYQWIYREAPHLIGYLARAHKSRYPKYHKRTKYSTIPNRISIEERPIKATRREEAGHWETDLVVSSKSKYALQVCVERKSRKTLIRKIGNKTVNESIFALENMLKNYPKDLRASITYDNGSENTGHERLNEIIGTKSYFCAPYASWEKGSVENRNGIIRRFFPKKTDFAKVENDKIKEVESWINNRPMKCLGFQTPAEVFNGFVALAP